MELGISMPPKGKSGEKIDTIFIDMDGVLVDWVSGVCTFFDVDLLGFYNYWEKFYRGEFSKEKVLSGYLQQRVTRDKIDHYVNRAGAPFWENLPIYEYSEHWIRAAISLVGKENVFICTSPMSGVEGCAQGKINWIKDTFKSWGLEGMDRNFVMTYSKRLVATPKTLLIDDSENQVAVFSNYIKVDRPWNFGGIDAMAVTTELINGFEYE